MKSTPKRLRSLTIVPDSLYVAREADRQLERVVDEMGRPAYILVARQMGKTNLLLHMKRTREAKGDIACYFDLSNRSPTLQSFFRTIIDTAAVALNASDAWDRIEEDRARGLEPNVEYDLHLRLLLETSQPQRLILFFDEIDSLIGVSYSDKVLAQMRSMYFARENHVIYDKLTYVLSGVAEPTDLIKDKNISPFNIGEKIYLENFSLSELRALLKKAQLDLPPSLIERVFYWTSGNPRMSWDICAALEDMMLGGERLTPEHVDTAVERVYLYDFDRAPVDHIRTLVRADPSLRDALMLMHYGNADTLDDSIRSRLFLAGITRSGRTLPEFNNRVISEALSTNWLSRLTDDHASSLEAATRHYKERDYRGAVRLFENYIERISEDTNPLGCAYSMQFGIALYHLQRYDDAQRRLELARAAPSSTELKAPILFYLASSKLLAGYAEASVSLFEEVALLPGEFEYLAKLALAGALVSVSTHTHSQRIISLTNEIISRDSATSDEAALELTASAYYNQALAQIASNNRALGLDALNQALAIAPSDLVPGIYLKTIDVLDDPVQKKQSLLHVVKLLEHNLPMARRYGATALSFSNFTLGALIAKALQIDKEDAAPRLISLAQKSLNESSIGRIAVRILGSTGPHTEYAILRPLIEAALVDLEEQVLTSIDIIILARASVIAAEASIKRDAFMRYVSLINKHEESFYFDETDALIFVSILTQEVNDPNISRANKITSFIDRFREQFIKNQVFIYLIYLNQKMALYTKIGEHFEVKGFAQEIIDILTDPLMADSELFEPALQSLVSQIETAARSTLAISAPDRFRKLSRNQIVRYKDTRTGQEKMAKFKKVERSLRSGQFVLISPRLEELY